MRSNPALQRSGNSRLWRLLPPAELWRWASPNGRGATPTCALTTDETMQTQRNLLFAWQRLIAAALMLVALPGYTAESVHRSVRVALVHPQSPSTAARGYAEFWERLRELGYVEGQNLVIETRWAEGYLERLPGLLAQVVALNVDAIVTWGTPAAIAAKNATSTIPIVAVAMGEPLRTGLATNLARPGGNLILVEGARGRGA
jgi:ABC-type uncharacterized transport system substrate-binding protein